MIPRVCGSSVVFPVRGFVGQISVSRSFSSSLPKYAETTSPQPPISSRKDYRPFRVAASRLKKQQEAAIKSVRLRAIREQEEAKVMKERARILEREKIEAERAIRHAERDRQKAIRRAEYERLMAIQREEIAREKQVRRNVCVEQAKDMQEARMEFLKALVEDSGKWQITPDELIYRRYHIPASFDLTNHKLASWVKNNVPHSNFK
eukprot:TRINITY_DN23313_c0_g1_i1.p1 TRINITY_DN23313_c0_g1~~TRINITY_DN23313_c0_g1_i1.p1  ORF type:complete len:213 (+),score=12.04 TRINITY_DN23313_c0_g1_i1:24-641(+)